LHLVTRCERPAPGGPLASHACPLSPPRRRPGLAGIGHYPFSAQRAPVASCASAPELGWGRTRLAAVARAVKAAGSIRERSGTRLTGQAPQEGLSASGPGQRLSSDFGRAHCDLRERHVAAPPWPRRRCPESGLPIDRWFPAVSSRLPRQGRIFERAARMGGWCRTVPWRDESAGAWRPVCAGRGAGDRRHGDRLAGDG
jgi:hypothetical protein